MYIWGRVEVGRHRYGIQGQVGVYMSSRAKEWDKGLRLPRGRG